MKCLSFIFKNIKTFFLRHTAMFFFLIIVQIVCCVSVFVICGMAHNMYYIEDTIENPSTSSRKYTTDLGNSIEYDIATTYNSEEAYTDNYYIVDGEKTYTLDYSDFYGANEIIPYIEQIADYLGEDFAFCTLLLTPGETVDIRDTNTPTQIMSIYPGNQTTAAGEKFEHASGNIFSGNQEKYSPGDTVTINNITYNYIPTNYGFLIIPYQSLQDCFKVRAVSIILTELPTLQRRTEIENAICDILGMDLEFDRIPETYEPAERQISQMVYVISIVVMLIILFALAKFYSYILSNRQKTLTVLRLCGGTKRQIHFIYMIEIFLTMIVTSALGYVLFRYVFYEPIASMYPSFEVFFTPDIYITILAAYIVLALIIMAITIIPATKASIIDMKRG